MIFARAGCCACRALLVPALALLAIPSGACGGGRGVSDGAPSSTAPPASPEPAQAVPPASKPDLPPVPASSSPTSAPQASRPPASPSPASRAAASYPSSLYVEHDVRVTARRAGLIDRVLVDRGAAVRAGQPLAGIEADEAAQELVVAEAEERFARAERDRMIPLASEKIVSPQDLLRAETALDRAAARSSLARTLLERCTVKAPFDGVVVERWAVVGQRVTDDIDSPPLFRIAAREPYRARVDLAEADLDGIRPGSAAVVVGAEARGPVEVSARVVHVGSAVDAASGTAPVIVQVTGAPGALRLGSAVSVRFVREASGSPGTDR